MLLSLNFFPQNYKFNMDHIIGRSFFRHFTLFLYNFSTTDFLKFEVDIWYLYYLTIVFCMLSLVWLEYWPPPFKDIFTYLFEIQSDREEEGLWERERRFPSAGFSPQMAITTRVRPGWSQEPGVWVIFCCLPKYINRKLDQKSSCQNSNQHSHTGYWHCNHFLICCAMMPHPPF